MLVNHDSKFKLDFNLVENVPAVAGSYIEGPIAAFKITSGGCLAYDTQGKYTKNSKIKHGTSSKL